MSGEERAGGLVSSLTGWVHRAARRAPRPHRRPRSLAPRLDRVERSLRTSIHRFHGSSDLTSAHPRVAEWLLDNAHLVQGAVEAVRDGIPPGFYRRLPAPADEASPGDDAPGGSPAEDGLRIIGLAREFLEHQEHAFDLELAEEFVAGYQETEPLTLGELWALASALRLVTLEELAGLVVPLVEGEGDVEAASAETASASGPSSPATLAARKVPVCIETLRQLSEVDWGRFFQRTSLVERTLRRDPGGYYARMDDDSRDRYRKAVEEIAVPASARSEIAIAEAAVRLAGAAGRGSRPNPASGLPGPAAAQTEVPEREGTPAGRAEGHVGYYLVDRGRDRVIAAVESHQSTLTRFRRWLVARGPAVYFSALGLGAILTFLVVTAWVHTRGGSAALMVATGLLAIVPAVTISVAAVHWLATHLLPPRALPKLEFGRGEELDFSTAVVVPCMLTSPDEVREILDRLEVLYQGSAVRGLHFALLTDYADAPEQKLPGEQKLVDAARAGVERLNRRYGPAGSGPFHLLHRERRWNPSEERWMGWERKRGKLHEFNRLLRGDEDTSFVVHVGESEALEGVRFVITLDADTRLPPGAASQLVGALAHPLNRPRFDDAGEVTRGYTVLQPRLQTTPGQGAWTPFTRVFEGDSGLDLYSHAVSDLYQDLFGEGIYVGKGIYDVDAFDRALAGRVPENTLLSHDLFEGICGRAALVSDITLFEDYPSHPVEYMRRFHRWVRGDWQLLPWILEGLAGLVGRGESRFSAVDLWKMGDNLRRSLLAPSLVGLVGVGLLSGVGNPWIWLAWAAGVVAFPTFLGAAAAATRRLGRHRSWIRGREAIRRPMATLRRLARDGGLETVRWMLWLVFLPYETWVALDAVGRTLYRLAVSRRHLLEWATAAHVARGLGGGRRPPVWKEMAAGPVAGVSLGSGVWLMEPAALAPVLALAVPWILSPAVADLLGRPRPPRRVELSARDVAFLRRSAIRTWFFFERFMDSEHHWLPPDNCREAGDGGAADRTSPTNIGLGLTAVVAAYDLGYIDSLALEATLHNALESMTKLQRHRGHFLNWYSTRDLRPLKPEYVSTVDSGNLAACLLTVSQGVVDVRSDPPVRSAQADGLLDVLSVLREEVESCLRARTDPERLTPVLRAIEEARVAVRRGREGPNQLVGELLPLSEQVLPRLEERIVSALEWCDETMEARHLRRVRIWSRRTKQHVKRLLRVVQTLLPWLPELERVPALYREGGETEEDGETDEDLRGVRRRWSRLEAKLRRIPTLRSLPAAAGAARQELDALDGELEELAAAGEHGGEFEDALGEARGWNLELRELLEAGESAARHLMGELDRVGETATRLAEEMDFGFLYDRRRDLFHLGFDVDTGDLDSHHYDLLASEARLASLLAMAKDDAPVRHWVHLGRPFRTYRGAPVLLSWGGSMFEYLLPAHFTRTPPGSLLDRSCKAAVEMQRRYGRETRAPWGLSESGYAETDGGVEYGYRAFGVPALRMKREQEERVVVAPYSSFLALPFDPSAAVKNLRRLADRGMLGTYGFREALDLGARTDGRRRKRHDGRVVRSYMAHHQGMALLAVDNTLRDDVMIRRLHRDPRIRSVDHVLSEATPWAVPAGRRWLDRAPPPAPVAAPPTVQGWTVPAAGRAPAAQLLSNGSYRVWVTAAGAGSSARGALALTRGTEDPTVEDRGQWIYVRDGERDLLWSAARAPVPGPAGGGMQLFSPHLVEFHRRDHGIGLETRICVPPGDDLEIRHLTVSNLGGGSRRLALCSYGEVALSRPAEDRRHPAFSKLFVEAEFLPEHGALVYRRRPRASDEASAWLGHTLLTGRSPPAVTRWSTDRERFLGRNGSATAPAFFRGRGLTDVAGGDGTVGEVEGRHSPLDPIFALETTLALGAYETRELAWITGVAESRDRVLELLDRYRLSRVQNAFEQARETAVRRFQRHGLRAEDGRLSQRLLSALRSPRPELRASEETFRRSELPRSALWRHGVSGDLPVLLLRLHDVEEVGVAARLLRVHALWRRQGIRVDLVILDARSTGYAQPLRDRLRAAVSRESDTAWLGEDGGIHLLAASELGDDEERLLASTAAVLLEPRRAEPDAQLAAIEQEPERMPAFVSVPSTPPGGESTAALELPAELEFDNGLGGFADDGREYVIRRLPDAPTPAPWCNVLANPEFGCLVSESSLGCTWDRDSGEFRLTPWRNDPVTDVPAEAVYLRDEETAAIWSATPSPCGGDVPWEVRHRAGSSVFRHRRRGLDQRLTISVAVDAPVKIAELQLRNLWDRPRRLTVTYYAEWVLGTDRTETLRHVVPDYDAAASALLARNPRSPRFPGRVAFLTSDRSPHGLTADRTEFLGRPGSLERPEGLERIGFSGTVRPGGDACAAYQVHVDLAPGSETTVRFLLGSGRDRGEAVELARRFRDGDAAERAVTAVREQWDSRLGALAVRTPDRALDHLVNRWLPAQTLSSRLRARTAFYQSSGAFGFRDQLQDVLAFLLTDPELARRQILRAATRQFPEGDVLHWWHPDTTRGVRTRCSDDMLWLPFATAEYLDATGEESILDERVPFLAGPELSPDEDERYEEFGTSGVDASLYRHCLAAIERAGTAGRHGLPLMGTGDWNDGMDRVGAGGEGESVWLGWFLHAVLRRFAPWCRSREDEDLADEMEDRARSLALALEDAWDGEWYHRAYYDDGTPLGSASDGEARIDAISQAWAVLSGAAPPERTRVAMESVWSELVRPDDGLVLLLAPPFDRTRRDPGYIRGYPPGVRENGGQYTHAAAWVGWAFAELGDAERAYRVLRMLNPVHRTRKREDAERYRVEPYVQAADVYGAPPHVGRGGWTWYTGSAAWTRRLAVEAILGLRRRGDRLEIRPVLPPDWSGYEAELTVRGSRYSIEVTVDEEMEPGEGRAAGEEEGVGREGGGPAPELWLDGELLPEGAGGVPLEPDSGTRTVRVVVPGAGGKS